MDQNILLIIFNNYSPFLININELGIKDVHFEKLERNSFENNSKYEDRRIGH